MKDQSLKSNQKELMLLELEVLKSKRKKFLIQINMYRKSGFPVLCHHVDEFMAELDSSIDLLTDCVYGNNPKQKKQKL